VPRRTENEIDFVSERSDASIVSDSFDGAGKPYRGSSFRGWIVVLIVSIVVIVLLWHAYAEALDMLPPGTPSG
jgi:hypothetical protein